VVVEGVDLLGTTKEVVGGGRSFAGRPRVALRPLISLVYLQHGSNLSDEELCERWS
jgi:IS5 family transposase